MTLSSQFKRFIEYEKHGGPDSLTLNMHLMKTHANVQDNLASCKSLDTIKVLGDGPSFCSMLLEIGN